MGQPPYQGSHIGMDYGVPVYVYCMGASVAPSCCRYNHCQLNLLSPEDRRAQRAGGVGGMPYLSVVSAAVGVMPQFLQVPPFLTCRGRPGR